jgi:hypothetical protein
MNSADITLPVATEQILEQTRLKITIARQHFKALQEFGLTPTWLDQLELAADAAEAIPSFVQQKEELKSLTAAKNAALEDCIQWGRKLRYRMQLVFDKKTPVGMQFPIKEWRESERNESRLIALFPSLITMAKQHKIALANAGQTDVNIQEGEQLLAILKTANEAQEEYKLTRSTITAKRRQAFKGLYDGVNHLNQMGQMVYGTDTAEGLLFRSNWQVNKNNEEIEEEEIQIEEIIDNVE